VGSDALLPTQNPIFRVGKFESRGAKVEKKIGTKPFLAHPLQKSCRRPMNEI